MIINKDVTVLFLQYFTIFETYVFNIVKRLLTTIMITHKKLILLIGTFLFYCSTSFADEFKIISFQKDNTDIAAIINDFKRLDDNDEICAIIKVRTDLSGLGFTSSSNIVGNVIFKNGEYWVYVSGGTRQLSVFSDGFIKLSYNLPEEIVGGAVYLLALSAKSGGVMQTGKGTLIITSNPDVVDVSIDGFPDLIKQTPCSFENYMAGRYRFSFQRDRYNRFDSVITIEKNIQKQINVTLTPSWGNLIVTSNIENTEFIINNKNYKGNSLQLSGEILGLDPGTYKLLATKENHRNKEIDIIVNTGKTNNYDIILVPIKTAFTLTTQPSGASIYIDNIFHGESPLTSESLIIGNHNIRVAKKGYIDENRDINLIENENEILNISLRNHTDISIKSSPSGAKVFINNDYKGKTPLSCDVISGESTISIKKDNHKTINETINITAANTYEYNLTRESYKLKVLSNPSSANVKIDGVNKGVTPLEVDLAYNDYSITVEKDKHIRRSKNIELDKNETINFKLSKKFLGYLGMLYVPPKNEYEFYKVGFDLGWSYKKAPRLMTGIAYNYGYDKDITSSLPSNVVGIEKSDYPGLYTNNMDVDGFIEQKVNTYLLRLGLIVSRPALFVISISAGLYTATGYDVYTADNYYSTQSYPDLSKGDRFIETNSKHDISKLIYGCGILLPLGNFYLSGDYMLSNNFVNFGPEYMIGFGYNGR